MLSAIGMYICCLVFKVTGHRFGLFLNSIIVTTGLNVVNNEMNSEIVLIICHLS